MSDTRIYTVKGPDGRTYEVEGPVGATEAQLGAFIANASSPPTREQLVAARDNAQKVVDTARAAKYPNAKFLFEHSQGPELDAAEAALKAFDEEKLRQAPPSDAPNRLKYLGHMLISPVLRGLASLPAMAAAAGMAEPRAASIKNPEEYNPGAPLESVAKIGFTPRTPAERWTSSGIEGAVSNVGSGLGFMKNAVVGASSGLGSEASASVLGDNAITRIVGALAGGAGPAFAMGKIPTAQSIIRRDMSALTEEDIKSALEKEATLQASGMPYSSAQLFGIRSTLPDTFERASSNQFVRPRVLGRLADASTRATDSIRSWMAGHLPPTGASSRETLADVQEAAARREMELKNEGNLKYTEELPPGLSSETYSGDTLSSVAAALRAAADNPDTLGPLTSGGRNLNRYAGRLERMAAPQVSEILDAKGNPITTPSEIPKGYVNNLLKELNVQATPGGFRGVPLAESKAAIRGGTPEFQAARDAKAQHIETELNPFQQGLGGQLARMGGGVRPDKYTAVESAIKMVLSPTRHQPGEIAELSRQIGSDNVAALLQEHLSRAINEAVVPTTSVAERLKQPFTIQANARGAPGSALRANTDAALREAANSYKIPASQLQGSFHKIMDALETYGDLKVAGSVDRASIDQAAGRNIGSAVVAPLSRAGRYIQDAVMSRTYRQIADLASSPEGARLLIAVGRSPNPSVLPAFIRAVSASAEMARPEQQQ